VAESAGDLQTDTAALLAAEEHEVSIVGRSPWYLAWRRLRRNYVALFSLLVFLVIVICCALAPVYARHIAQTGPNAIHADQEVRVS
jgi:peptide/nickel transport system permease protein